MENPTCFVSVSGCFILRWWGDIGVAMWVKPRTLISFNISFSDLRTRSTCSVFYEFHLNRCLACIHYRSFTHYTSAHNATRYLPPSPSHYMFRPFADIIRCHYMLQLFHCLICATSLIACKCDVRTYSRSWARLEEPPIEQPLKNFLALYGTQRLNTVFTRTLHWSLYISLKINLLH
jgi:hypothetical protein